MADDLSRRGFLRESGKAVFGPVMSALNDTEEGKKTGKTAAARPALSPGGLAIFYDEAHPYGYIVAPGTETRIPMDRRYSAEHIWVKILPGNKARVGVTERIPPFLKTIAAIDLPEAGDEVFSNRCFGSLEGGKANMDLISPLHGKIIESNIDIKERPEKLYSDPYDNGWMLLIQLSHPEEIEALMTPDQYAAAAG
jgi:glycine cleavage system H protein